MFGKLKSSWSEWAPVLQQLPGAAVDGVTSGLQATAAAGRSAIGRQRAGGAGAANASAAGGAIATSSAHASSPSAGAAAAPAAASASSDTNVAAGGGQALFSLGSKLASGLKGIGSRVGTAQAGAASALTRGRNGRGGEEEREQRSFLIPPTTPRDDDANGAGAAAQTKSSSSANAFSFDDEPEEETTDAFDQEPAAAAPVAAALSNQQTRAALFGSRASSSASFASAAGHSSAATAASPRPPASAFSSSSAASSSSLSASAPRGSDTLVPMDELDPDVAASFADLPPLSSSDSRAPSSRAPQTASGYVQAHAQAARDLEAQQEALLEDMSHSIARLQGIGTEINSQLTVQSAMLDELNEGVDEAQGRFDMLNRKLEKLLARSGWSHYKIIFCLLLLIFFLLVLIFIL